ncbi:membrane progestin receptor gamma-like [Pollicipes pollicipes]|uniref:membrane progestin receptor gamma-like n=1 Tax=Pollicipes pollicipes TaxID=41117 RepID=UPI00188583B5|nr:membrane progestin receptor gamma-like [Pollicipes pollicipes]
MLRGCLPSPLALPSSAVSWIRQRVVGVRLLTDAEVEPSRRELHITSGYLPSGSYLLCLQALVLPTNELFNTWSSLLATLVHTWRLWLSTADVPAAAYVQPYQLCLLAAAVSALTSALAHGLYPASRRANHLFFCLDYVGLGLYGLAVTLAYQAYGSSAPWSPFLPGTAVLAVLGSAAACASRLTCRRRHAPLLRALSLTAPYLSSHVVCSVVAAAAYVTRWPECRWPGRHDVLGHSHGWFHVFGQLAVVCQVAAAQAEMALSAGEPPAQLRWWVQTGFGWTAALMLAVAPG